MKLNVNDSIPVGGHSRWVLNDPKFRIPVLMVAQPIAYARRIFRFTAAVAIALLIYHCDS